MRDFFRHFANGMFLIFVIFGMVALAAGAITALLYLPWIVLLPVFIMFMAWKIGVEMDYGHRRGKWFWEGWFK